MSWKILKGICRVCELVKKNEWRLESNEKAEETRKHYKTQQNSEKKRGKE